MYSYCIYIYIYIYIYTHTHIKFHEHTSEGEMKILEEELSSLRPKNLCELSCDHLFSRQG